MGAKHIIGLSKLWAAADHEAHSARDGVPIEHVGQMCSKCLSAATRKMKRLIPIDQGDLIASAELVVVASLRGHLATVNQSRAVAREMYYTVRRGCGYGGTRGQLLHKVNQPDIRDARFLPEGAQLPRPEKVGMAAEHPAAEESTANVACAQLKSTPPAERTRPERA